MIHVERNATVIYRGEARVIFDPAPHAAGGVVVQTTVGGVSFTQTGGSSLMYNLPVDMKVELKISYQDAHGNPAAVDGAVQWESSNTEVATVMPVDDAPEDNSHVWLVAGSALGNVQITAKADADLGEGVRELLTPFDVTVVAGEAVAGTIEPAGAAVPQ